MSKIEQAQQPKWLKTLRKLPFQLKIVGHLLRLYLLPSVNAEALRETVR
jgi:magnesium-protoporphyrin IX monomethyl ester (oxidative) cyclase